MNYTNNGYTLRYALRRMGVQLPDEHPEYRDENGYRRNK